VGDLFDGYGSGARGLTEAAFDEMVGLGDDTRSPYATVASSLSQMGPHDVSARATRLARAFMDQGVTFDLDGEERPFPLDVIPRIFTAAEWTQVSDGVAQRVRALESFLADVYSTGRIVSDGVIPHEVVTSSPGFVRAAYGLNPTNGVRIHVAGIDVIRDEEGEFRVLEDNVRSPSGVSYVLANRAAMARVLPELFWGQPIQMVTDYPAHLIYALRRAAPAGVQDPTVVVLTPGVHNSAFYEHALLARLMGVHLVEGRDLVCHGTEVFLRTTEGEVPVHVIYRRIDDEYLDPLQFRPESLVGCPGVLNAARAGRFIKAPFAITDCMSATAKSNCPGRRRLTSLRIRESGKPSRALDLAPWNLGRSALDQGSQNGGTGRRHGSGLRQDRGFSRNCPGLQGTQSEARRKSPR